MASVNEQSQLEEESHKLDRIELQTYLKANNLKATGTTASLRKAYVDSRRSAMITEESKASILPLVDAKKEEKNDQKEQKMGDQKKRKAPPPTAAAAAASPAAATNAATVPAKKEKRLKRFRTTCSYATRQRIARARTQRLYLVESPKLMTRKNDSNNESNSGGDNHNNYASSSSGEFVVMGSTGNLYTVTISNLVHCTCPDAGKGNVCKHILFVLLKVVGLSDGSPLLYQAALLNNELEEIFTKLQTRMDGIMSGGGSGRNNNNGGNNNNIMANASVQRAYKELTSPDPSKKKGQEEEEDGSGGIKRQPIDDAECPICFDSLVDETTTTTTTSLVFCKAMCGANFHSACMANWKLNQQRSKKTITCPNCRTPWQDADTNTNNSNNRGRGGSFSSPEGYTNLGRLQGQSLQRDVSSYSEWFFGY